MVSNNQIHFGIIPLTTHSEDQKLASRFPESLTCHSGSQEQT